MCKKGMHNHQNQDNFFVLCDGFIKMTGIFDGHGANGHLISSFAKGTMLDYIKNAKPFRDIDWLSSYQGTQFDARVTKAIRLAFKYVQDRIREQFEDFVIHKKKV